MIPINNTRAMNQAVTGLYSRARELAREKVKGSPIAKDPHGVNVLTDCGLRALLLPHLTPPGVPEQIGDPLDLMHGALMNNPNWGPERRAVTLPPNMLRMLAKLSCDLDNALREKIALVGEEKFLIFRRKNAAKQDIDAEQILNDYALFLEAAQAAIDEYLESGGQFPEVEEVLSQASE